MMICNHGWRRAVSKSTPYRSLHGLFQLFARELGVGRERHVLRVHGCVSAGPSLDRNAEGMTPVSDATLALRRLDNVRLYFKPRRFVRSVFQQPTHFGATLLPRLLAYPSSNIGECFARGRQ